VDVDTSGTPPLDLSKATKLKDISLRCNGPNVQPFAMALQTVQSKRLQQITIQPCGAFVYPVEETVLQELQDLDRTLVQFWTSHSDSSKDHVCGGEGKNDLRGLAPSLLPELTRRGAVDLVEK
jgi:hypothetical protein